MGGMAKKKGVRRGGAENERKKAVVPQRRHGAVRRGMDGGRPGMRDRPEGTGGVRREGDAGERAAAVQTGERCAARENAAPQEVR